MTSMETRNQIDELKARIERELGSRYHCVTINGRRFYQRGDGLTFAPFYIGFRDCSAFGIEYANTMEEAKQGLLEDGSHFAIEDMTIEKLIESLCSEIESEAVL